MKVTVYRNRRSENKYLEVHNDGHCHNTVRQFMYWPETGVCNKTGDGKLHRWRISNLRELLKDYVLLGSTQRKGITDISKGLTNT